MASSADGAIAAVHISSVCIAGQDYTDGGASFASSRIVASPIEVATDPAAVEQGIDCGMPDMCGLDPCLCGAADAWGACACNGTEEVPASISYASSDPSVASVEEAFGVTWIVPHGAGDAVITVSAELPHYTSALCEVEVHVGGMTAVDAVAIGGAALVAAIVVAVIVAAARKIARRKNQGGHNEG